MTPTLPVPESIARPPYARGQRVPSQLPPPIFHDAAGIAAMKDICAKASEVLHHAIEAVQPGMTADDIDRMVHEKTLALGVYPSPLLYSGFPKSVCVSINEVVCHGIPDKDAVVREGDLVKLDVSCYSPLGYHGDNCRTVVAGDASKLDLTAKKMLQVGKLSLNKVISICGPGVPFSAVGEFVEEMVKAEGFAVVREFCGHGIGRTFHTEPLVMHYKQSPHQLHRPSWQSKAYGGGGQQHKGPVMEPGMTFTIEPMVVERSAAISCWPDGWTIVTADGGRSVQYEHTLLVTDNGVEVLTAYEGWQQCSAKG